MNYGYSSLPWSNLTNIRKSALDAWDSGNNSSDPSGSSGNLADLSTNFVSSASQAAVNAGDFSYDPYVPIAADLTNRSGNIYMRLPIMTHTILASPKTIRMFLQRARKAAHTSATIILRQTRRQGITNYTQCRCRAIIKIIGRQCQMDLLLYLIKMTIRARSSSFNSPSQCLA